MSGYSKGVLAGNKENERALESLHRRARREHKGKEMDSARNGRNRGGMH
jgi:hypothetical protein